MNDVKLKMKPAVAVEKLNFQCCYNKSEEKEQYPCSGRMVRKLTEQDRSVSDYSSPSHLTYRTHVEEVAVHSRSNSNKDQSLKRTGNREDMQHRSGRKAGHKDLVVVGQTPLGINLHQEEKIYRMQSKESQQQNETFLTVEASGCSSMDSSECVVVKDENELTPIMKIDNQKDHQTCSDNPMTEQQKHCEEFMYELAKLRQELEIERGMRQKLENKISYQSKKIKELKVKVLSKDDVLTNPLIQLTLEAVTKGKYISTMNDSESSDASSPSFSFDAADEIKPELCDESSTEDAALSTDDHHLHKSTLDGLTNSNKSQRRVTGYEGMPVLGRESGKECNLKKHRVPAFDNSVSCANDKTTDSSRKRKASQEQLRANSENSPKRWKKSPEFGVFSSNSFINEGVNTDARLELQQQNEFIACTKEVEIAHKRTGSVLKGSEYNSESEGLSPEVTPVDIARKRRLNEMFSEITSGKSKAKAKVSLRDQLCSDDRNNNYFTRNDTKDTNLARNHDKQRQVSEGKTDKRLRKVENKNGELLPVSNLHCISSEKHSLHDSGSLKHADHEVRKLARGNEHLTNQSSSVDQDCILSKSRKQNFTEMKSGSNMRKIKSNCDFIDQSCPDFVNENSSLYEPLSRDGDSRSQGSASNTARINLKQMCTETNKSNSDLPSLHCITDDVLRSKGRTKSISPKSKTMNPGRSSLDYSYSCNLCGLKFCDMESLQCHMPCVASVTNKDPLKCGACSKTFKKSIDLEKHLQELRTNKLFKCEICDKSCASKSCLAWHMQVHVDIEAEKSENQSKALLSKDAKTSQKLSECTICNKRFLSKLCLQSHMKQHKENERESYSLQSIVECQRENRVIPKKSSISQEHSINRSFQDALGIGTLFTSDLVSKHTELHNQNSRNHCDRERSSWSIFDQDRLLCDFGSSLPFDLHQKKMDCGQSRSSVSIFDEDTSSKITTGQNQSIGLICAQEISSETKKTYRPYCVKCWDTFVDLQALEEHSKLCGESFWQTAESSRKLIPIRINECTTKSEVEPQSSEGVMENDSEEAVARSFDDVAKSSSFEALRIGIDLTATSKLHDNVDEEPMDGLDEEANSESHDWAKNNLDGMAKKEPDDLQGMLHVLANNAAHDSDDLAESFSEELANTEAYLDNGESDFIAANSSEEVTKVKSNDLVVNDSGDLGKIGWDETVEDASRSVVGTVIKTVSSNFSSGSHELLKGGLTDLIKCRSYGDTKNSSHEVNLIKSGSQKLSNCGSDDALYCLQCQKAFSSHQKLNKHLELHRLFGSSLRCSRCKQKFSLLDSVQEHTCKAYSVLGPLFKCPECEEGFEIGRQFKKHMCDVHNMEQPFKCKHCGRQYEKFCHWNYHIQAHRTEKRYVCNKCGTKYKFLHHLKVGHLPCISDSTELKCPKCNLEFVKTSLLRSHVAICRNDRAVKCQVCSRLFISQSKLVGHMRCHTDAKSYKCSQCDKCFSFRAGLRRHVECHSAEKPYVCDTCCKTFADRRDLQSHLKIHINSSHEVNLIKSGSQKLSNCGSDDALYCLQCQKAFSSHQKLNKHLELHRLFGSSLHCSRCKQKFSLLDSIQEHTCKAYTILGPLFKCPECQDGFEIGRQFKKHMCDVHNMEQPFKCKHCGRQYEKFFHWNYHVQAHRTEKRYVCNKCGIKYKFLHHLKVGHLPCISDSTELKCPKCNLEFVKASLLRSHVAICRNERAVKCQVCSRLFISQSKLVGHMRCHTDTKSYKCSQCDKCFSFRAGLRRHVECHSAEKPYVCDTCCKTFADRRDLQSHLKIHITEEENRSLGMNINGASNQVQKTEKRICKMPKHFYGCGLCGSLYIAISSLKRHLPCEERCAGENDPLFCGGCSKRFCELNELEKHVSSVHSEYLFICSICSKTFVKKRSLRLHMHSHTGGLRHICKGCNQGFRSRYKLKYHIPCYGSDIQCNQCQMTFNKISQLRTHIRIDHSNKAVQCDVCGRKCLSHSVLDAHLRSHEADKVEREKPYSCVHCNKCFVHSSSLKNHLETVHLDDSKCDVGKENSIEALGIGVDVTATSNLHDNVDLELKDTLNEETNSKLYNWAMNSLDEHPKRESSDLQGMLHVLANNTADESDDLAESFSKELANTEAYLDNGESDFIAANSSEEVTKVKSNDLVVNGSGDLGKIGWDETVEDASRSVVGTVIKTVSSNFNSGSHELLKGGLTDLIKCRSDGVTKNSSHEVNLIKSGSQKLSNCGSDDALYCLQCQKAFSSHQKLNKHLELHRLFGSSLRCSRCKQKFSLLDSVQEHTCKAYSVLGPLFKCPECEEGFEIGVRLKRHMRDVHFMDQPLKCKHCGKQYEKFCHWNYHIQTHRTGKRYVCNKCGKKFKYLRQLKRFHLPCISDSTELKCPTCNLEFVKASLFHSHMAICRNERAVKCQVCSRLFISQSRLDRHMRCHTGDKPYQCSECDRCFSYREGLISHVHCHSAVKPYVCDTCCKTFATNRSLQRHLKIHMTDQEKLSLIKTRNGTSNQVQKTEKGISKMPKRFYGCGLCGSLYIAIISLKRHLPCEEGGAGENDPLICGGCSERFCELNDLEKHVSSVHSEDLFICSICSKTFVKKRSLRLHMHSHTGGLRHICKGCNQGFRSRYKLKYHIPCYGSDIQCNQCQMTFNKISQLRTHIRIDHSNKAVQCDVCGRKCLSHSVLDAHLRSHEADKVEREKPYSCVHCNRCFVHSSSLRRHLETVHLDPLKCDVGNENFKSKYQYEAYLRSHIYLNKADNTLCCVHCLKAFTSQKQLKKHLELHKQFGSSLNCSRCNKKFSPLDLLEGHTCQAYSVLGPLFKCPECEEGFEIGGQFKKHMSKVHSMEQPFKCKRCGKQYEQFSNWNYHVQAHRTEKRYVCNKCGKSFKFLHHLKGGHLPCISESTELKCPKCDEEFLKVSLLRNHVRLCQNEQAVKCHICNRLFDGQSRLNRHMFCHTVEKPYQCPQCDKCFSSRGGMMSHVYTHSDVKPYVCDVCGKAFAAEIMLRTHVRIHTADRPYKCSDCDKSYLYACLLAAHRMKAHSNVRKRFTCGICSKTYCSKMYLDAHMCSHTGQNPYLCSICGKGFPAKILLKYHMRVHTGEKPYPCQYCYRRFSMPRSLRNHERVHTGEKPYECTACGMKFSQSSYLKSHSKKVHMVQQESPKKVFNSI